MTSGFSSSDVAVLEQGNDNNLDDVVATPQDLIEEAYDVEKCINFIQENNCQKVALQFPDELLIDASSVTRLLQNGTSAKVFLLADTSYGSYDVDEVAAQHINADLIIHYGKSALTSSSSIKTLFVFGHKQLNCNEVSNAFSSSYPDKNLKILLLIQPQWYHTADTLKNQLQPLYPNLVFAKIRVPNVTLLPSFEEVPCSNSCPDCSCRSNRKDTATLMEIEESNEKCLRIGFYEIDIADNVSIEDYSVFFIGTENSETLRNFLMHQPSSSGFVYNPLTTNCASISLPINKLLMKRFFVIEQLRDAKTVGILVGTMGMSGYKDIISHLKKILSESGKKTYTFVIGKLNPNKLANFPEIDIFVLVACPEESFIDTKEYLKPICTPYEAEVACNANREWGSVYPLDFRQLLPGGKFYVDFKSRSDESDVSLITGNIRHHDNVQENVVSDVEVRNMNSTLSVFHPHAAAHHFANRSWKGLEQKLGETPVQLAKEGRSGLPVSYNGT